MKIRIDLVQGFRIISWFFMLATVWSGASSAQVRSTDQDSLPGIGTSNLPLNEMTPSEREEYASAQIQISEGKRLISEGTKMRHVQDGYSKMDGARLDRSATRVAGEQRLQQGQNLVRQGEARMEAIARSLSQRRSTRDRHEAAGSFRMWRDVDGRSVRAAFKSLKGDRVEFIRDDGQLFAVPLSQLSEVDIAYARLQGAGYPFSDDGFKQASQRGDAESLGLFFQSGFSPSTTCLNEALALGVKVQATPVCLVLLDKGAHPSAPDEEGMRPLSNAARAHNLELIQLLLAKGASPWEPDQNKAGLMPFSYALLDGYQSGLTAMLQAGTPLGRYLARATDLVQTGALRSVSPDMLDAITRLDRGEALDSVTLARVEIVLSGEQLSEEGFYRILEADPSSKLLRYYAGSGIVAAAARSDWERFIRALMKCRSTETDDLLKASGVSAAKLAEANVRLAGYGLSTDGFARAVREQNLSIVSDFIKAGHSPMAITSEGRTILFLALTLDNPQMDKIMLKHVNLSRQEMAAVFLEARGGKLSIRDKAVLQLHARGLPDEKQTFIMALLADDQEAALICLQAGVVDPAELSIDSSFWLEAWASLTPAMRLMLMDYLELPSSDRIYLRARQADITYWRDRVFNDSRRSEQGHSLPQGMRVTP